MVLPGSLLVYAAWSSGVVVPGLFGAPLILLGLLIFANPAFSKLQLDSGVLRGRSLLDRRVIQLRDITRIVPIRLTYRRTLLMPWKRSAEMFDVCAEDGPTGFWLNPNLYGVGPIQDLIQAIGIEPEAVVEDRVIEAFSVNRDYGRGGSG